MFNDERIIIESGKIFKKANLIALIISAVFLITRCIIYINTNHDLSFGIFATEICTLICTSIILIYGELAYKTKEIDERNLTSKYQYYSKKGKILLIWILIGYAISMIDSFKRAPGDFEVNIIIFIFQVVGVMFFYYQFKKNQININYSFINNDKRTYYIHVLKLIGYLAIIISLIYITCGIISMIIYQSWQYILVFLLAAVHSIIGLGLQYLLLSFLEKMDYDDEKEHIKKPFLIAGLVVIVVLFVKTILRGATIYIAENGLVSEMERFISYATKASNNLDYISTMYCTVALSYLLSYSLKEKHVIKSIKAYFILLFISTIVGIIVNIPVIINANSSKFLQQYYQIITYVDSAFTIAFIILFGLIIYSLIKDKGFNKSLIIIPVVKMIIYFVCIFLNTQNELGKGLSTILLGDSVDCIAWLLFYLLVFKKKS